MKETENRLPGFPEEEQTGMITEINIEEIVPSRYQPRVHFDEESLDELAASIRANGLIQPVAVRKTENGYEIIAGERRYRACRKAGMETIPCYILTPSESQAAEMALIENIQREDLTAVEEALSYVQIINRTGMTQEQIAERVGKSQSAIANKIRLLSLPEEIQDGISDRKITERHARALLRLPQEEQLKAYHHVLSKDLNVRQTDEYVEKAAGKQKNRKQKTKGFTRNVRIAVNSVNQCVQMIRKMGISAETEINDTESETKIIIRIPK